MKKLRLQAPVVCRAGLISLFGIALIWWAASRQDGVPDAALAQPLVPEVCHGDEVITFAPAMPLADEDLLVAVTSAYYHRGVWLTGTERVVFSQERTGQLGWVWTWTMTPTFPGPHRVQYFVDSTTPCAEATILVGPSASLQATQEPTPTPETTVLRRIVISRSSSDNSGDNSGDNSSDNTASASSAGAPQIASLDPTSVCPRDRLTIRGQGFGPGRSAVAGKVVVSGVPISDYLSWQDDEVVVLVPPSAAVGSTRDLFLSTTEGFAQTSIQIGGAACDANVASATPRASATLTEAASPSLTRTPVPTSTPTETHTATVSRTPTVTASTTPTPTTVPEPHITSLSAAAVCRESPLSILGQGFGASRQEVDGKVIISGVDVQDYLLWQSTEVQVLVPNGAALGPARDLYLVTDGGFDHTTVEVDAAC